MRRAHGGDIYGLNRPDILDFSVNTNPLGMPSRVAEAMRGAVEQAHIYPDAHNRALVAALAEYEGLPASWVLPGAGGAELIYRFAYATRPRRAMIPAPTFSEYAEALSMTDTRIDFYALSPRSGYELDLRICGRITPEIDALFLCNPNNPTGTVADPQLIDQVANACKNAGALLFVDECFIDFVEGVPSVKPLLERYPNLIILRALTKNYAMAGVRVGYVLSANRRLLERMNRAGPPWQISAFASAGAIAALGCRGHIEMARELMAIERPWLCAALSELGLKLSAKSQANYLLFEAPITDLRERMIARGILIRSCANYRGLPQNSYRVAIKQRSENVRLIETLKSALSEAGF